MSSPRLCSAGHVALLSLSIAACGAGVPLGAPSPALAGGSLRGEVIVVGTHLDVSAVAASRTTMFAATPDALLIFDIMRNAWLPPLSRDDGYPGGPSAIVAADPLDDGAWVAAFGSVLHYQPQLDMVTSTLVPGPADALFFDSRNIAAGAYVRAGGSWALVSRTGTAMPVAAQQLPPPGARLLPSTLNDVYRQHPQLRSFAALLTRDARLRSWPVSSGSAMPDRNEVFLGTRGNGVFRVDPIFQQSTHLPFGLIESGAASVAPAVDGVWIGGAGRSATDRGGVTWASHDLQRWRWFEGPAGRPLGRTRVESVASREESLWLATPRGVFRFGVNDPERTEQWTLANGLPSDHALALAPLAHGCWVGTGRGLAWIEVGSRDVRAAEGTFPVRALLVVGEKLWIGSDAGLLHTAARPGAAASFPVLAAFDDARLRRPVRALASGDSVLLVATTEDVLAIDMRAPSGNGAVRSLAPDAAPLPAARAVAIDERTFWVGNRDGITVVMRSSGARRTLRVGRELPAEPLGIALAPGVAWLATERGAVRLARQADGGVR